MPASGFDVIVAGAGPAGSTAATLLAQHGRRVLMIERACHPRFHIGESMLPCSTPVLERLGIQLEASDYQHKDGAEFIDEATGKSIRFALNARYQPYQVERARFDHCLADNAVAQGVTLHQEETVRAVHVDAAIAAVETDRQRYTARYIVDATGRSAFMGRQTSAIQRIGGLGCFALYRHYRVSSPQARALFDSGDIKVLMQDIGWIWVIPLANERLSVGLVVRDKSATALRGAALFEKYLAASPLLQDLLSGAVAEAGVRSEADFSFSNRQRYGQRYACCGDAAGFLDPVFSSGVFLALVGAERVADRVNEALANATEAQASMLAMDAQVFEEGFSTMRLFIERFYRSDMVQRLFFEADRSETIKQEISALLSGDLWRSDNAFQRMLLEGRQGRKRTA
jgi:flavin-dependent dehydrogenase